MRSRALVALTLVKLCKGGRCSYLRTPGCAAEPPAKLSPSGLRKFSAACMNPKAFIDDAPMGEEAFVFGGFRLLSAQRLLLEDEKPVHSAAVSWMCYSRSFKTQATHFTRINVFSANFRADDSAASTAGGSPSVAVPLELVRERAELKALRELNAADYYCAMSELV